MDGLGTITWESFLRDAEAIVKVSDDIHDCWELVGEKLDEFCRMYIKDVPGMAYLSRKIKTYVPCEYPVMMMEDDDETSGKSDEEDWLKNFDAKMAKDPFEADSKDEKRPLIILHHVLWSMSYSVPVLYFNGWKSDFPGCNPVSVQTAQRLIKNSFIGYSELSQAIHPILGIPFLQLHPCKSQELISHVSKSNNKLVSWLSAVAPAALQLKLPQDYYSLTIGTDSCESKVENQDDA